MATVPVKKHKMEEVKEVYSIEEVLPFLSSGKREYDGDWINMSSRRYSLFCIKGFTCVACGISGQYFRKERHKKCSVFHFNLYGIDKDGDEVLITKDHIIPKSKGGGTTIDNLQVMCKVCNELKGNGDWVR